MTSYGKESQESCSKKIEETPRQGSQEIGEEKGSKKEVG